MIAGLEVAERDGVVLRAAREEEPTAIDELTAMCFDQVDVEAWD